MSKLPGGPRGGEPISTQGESFSLSALYTEVRSSLQYQLADAAQDLEWIKTLDELLTAGEPEDYQRDCLEASTTGLKMDLLPSLVKGKKTDWLQYVGSYYPDQIKDGINLPGPTKQARERDLVESSVVAAHEVIKAVSKQSLLGEIEKDDPLQSIDLRAGLIRSTGTAVTVEADPQQDLDEVIDLVLSRSLATVQNDLANDIRLLCAEVGQKIPTKNGPQRLAASIFGNTRLSVNLQKGTHELGEARKAVAKLVKALQDLGDPYKVAAIVTTSVQGEIIGEQLAGHYNMLVKRAKIALIEDLKLVPNDPNLPRRVGPPTRSAKPRPKQYRAPLPAPSRITEVDLTTVGPEIDELTPMEETETPLTSADIRVKTIYKDTLAKYFEVFKSGGYTDPKLSQFYDLIRKTPDNETKVSILLALASFSGDDRIIHDAFIATEAIPRKDIRAPLYALCMQAYKKTGTMPVQQAYALARWKNPDAPIELEDYARYIRPQTAFRSHAATRTGDPQALDKAALEALFAEVEELFPTTKSEKTNRDTPPPESKDKTIKGTSQLPVLKYERVIRALGRLDLEIDKDQGKGGHAKVTNPRTGKTITIYATRGHVNPIPLGSTLTSLGIAVDSFLDEL